MEIAFLNPNALSWSADVDRLRELLGAPNNPYLFPSHFLKATFPQIGGRIAVVERDERLVGAGFLFPRAFRNGTREFTLRFHKADPASKPDGEQLAREFEKLLGGARVVFYDPQRTDLEYRRTTQKRVKGVDIGSPDAEEALAVRSLQQAIWGSEEDFLYPADIHSRDFRAGTSLVARVDGRPVGFLFGFYKFDGAQLPEVWDRKYGSDFCLESQVLGVLPAYRKHGIGTILKQIQAENARRDGIGVVNWTVDPLQYGNAVLNFGRLKAVAYDFYPDYYAFRNVLNQAPSSRFGITWLVDTDRVRRALSGTSRATILDLREDTTIRPVNRGWEEFTLPGDDPKIAIEIPANWTRLQRENLAEALRWRETTDRLFQHYLGREEGKYMVTGVGTDGDRRYLIAERVDAALLERLGG